MFTLARITARKPNPSPSRYRLTPAASIAPTMITEQIALVTAISGLCSAGVTFQTT